MDNSKCVIAANNVICVFNSSGAFVPGMGDSVDLRNIYLFVLFVPKRMIDEHFQKMCTSSCKQTTKCVHQDLNWHNISCRNWSIKQYHFLLFKLVSGSQLLLLFYSINK